MKEDCIFCAITKKTKPAEIVWEGNSIVAFKDMRPKAPVHLLIVPKKHVESIAGLAEEDRAMASDIIYAAKDIAASLALRGYRLSFNVGREGGQAVDHLHMHFLGGWQNGVHGGE